MIAKVFWEVWLLLILADIGITTMFFSWEKQKFEFNWLMDVIWPGKGKLSILLLYTIKNRILNQLWNLE